MAVLLVLAACLTTTLAAPSGEIKDVDFLMPSVQPKAVSKMLRLKV